MTFNRADRAMDHMPHPWREAQQERARALVVLSELARRTQREEEGAQG
jgi:hypothetical protein